MPTVSVVRDRLFEELGRTYTDEEFDELCFEYGLELDDVVEEKVGGGGRIKQGEEEIATVYKVDVPANRYDLLCTEGLVQALRVFKGFDEFPPRLSPTEAQCVVQVKAETKEIRPFVVCAVLSNISLSPAAYQSLIDLQEKLHHNICRQRSLVAIGTHDLDRLEGPFTYEALPPNEIRFAPLSLSKEYSADELMTIYETDTKLKAYLPLIREAPRYPVIFDSKRRVCSMPPIINGDHSKITLDTRNMFIECTATDRTKALIVLNVLVSAFSRYCEEAFSIEPVRIEYMNFDGTIDSVDQTPHLGPTEITASPKYISSLIGVDLQAEEISTLLNRMMLQVAARSSSDELKVLCPPYRADILHACDVAEDAAIAYGFNRVKEQIPTFFTTGRSQPLNLLSDLLRREALAQRGYTEVLTWVTVSHDENFTKMRRVDDNKQAVKISNPKSQEFQECRRYLLPGVLKTLRENRNVRLPLRLFEVGDVVRLEENSNIGAVNERRLCAVHCGTSAAFEVVKALLDHVMLMLGVEPGDGNSKSTFRLDSEDCQDEAFFPGRRADIIVGGESVGVIGWLHPEVLANFALTSPCSAIEMLVEPFLDRSA